MRPSVAFAHYPDNGKWLLMETGAAKLLADGILTWPECSGSKF